MKQGRLAGCTVIGWGYDDSWVLGTNYLAKAINHQSRLGPDKGGFRSNLVWWRLIFTYGRMRLA